jgi:phage regulator Rha-like protein
MLDSDLALIYNVETKVFNQAVKRNIDRFPDSFRFQLTKDEFDSLRSQIATLESEDDSLRSQSETLESQRGKHRKYLPYVFTEQGVSMLSAVLRSETAIKVSIQIINAFVKMRKFISDNAGIFQRLDKIELKQLESDKMINKVFKALEEKSSKPKHGVFYKGQIYDAYSFVCDIIRDANNAIILIDNYVDDTVLTLLNKRNKKVTAKIYTQNISKQLKLDLQKHNSQYPKINIEIFKEAHDRFLIIDNKTLYHFGASLKDLGKKWFAFSEMNSMCCNILEKLNAEVDNE